MRIGSVIAFQICVLVCYRDFISPRNEYAGFVFADIDPAAFFFWSFLYSLPAAMLPKEWAKPGGLVLWYLYLVTIAPFAPMTLAIGKAENLPIATIAFFVPFCLMAIGYKLIPRPAPFALGSIPVNHAALALSSLCVLGSILVVAQYSGSLSLSWDAIYDRRLEARSVTGTRSLAGYAITIFAQVLVPVTTALALTRFHFRNVSIFPALIGAIVVFSFNGTKTAIFTPLAMLLVSAAYTVRATKAIAAIATLILLTTTAYLMDAGGYPSLNELITRRVFIVPTLLANSYLEYFSVSGFLYFSDILFIGRLAGSANPGVPAGFLLGEDFLGLTGLNANVGAIPYGYAEAGIVGCWISACAIFGAILVVERASVGKNYAWVLPLAFAIAYRFSEQAFHTSLLTGGVAIIILFLLLVNDNKAIPSNDQVVFPAPDPILGLGESGERRI